MTWSANRIEREFGDKVMNRTFYPATNTREALINEDALMMQLGGPKSFNKNSPTYNLIHSPGKKYRGF